MEITTHQTNQFDTKELAAFIYKNRKAVLDERGMSLAELETELISGWSFIAYVLAHENNELIGCALLYRIGDSELIEINPSTVLGFHPMVAPGFDEDEVGIRLVEAGKDIVLEAGFNSLYIDIPWDPDLPEEHYEVYRKRYGGWGFEVIQQVIQMSISLPIQVPELETPTGFSLAQIQTTDEEALYQCHHAAYMAGEAQYYFQMDDEERCDDFNRVYAPNIRQHPASVVLTRYGQVVGCIMLFTEGTFSEVMSLAVHPDYRRQGLGTLLMRACLKRANQEGIKTMVLIVDRKNQSAAELYRKCGFKESGGNMTFKWKA